MGLNTGDSPSKYFNEKNKQAAPLKKDSPLKNSRLFNHWGVSHSDWDHDGQGGWVPTESNMEWLNEYHGYDEDGNSLNPWAEGGDPTEIEIPDEQLPPEDGGEETGGGDDIQGGTESNPGAGGMITYNGIGQAVNTNNDLADGMYFDVVVDPDSPSGYSNVDPYFLITDEDGNQHQQYWEPDDPRWPYGGIHDPDGDSGGGFQGGSLISSSLDPNRQTVSGKLADDREASGAHRWARGGQSQNPGSPEYPWGDDEGGSDINYDQDGDGAIDNEFMNDDVIRPIPDIEEVDHDPDGDGIANMDPERPIIPDPVNYDPDGDGYANVEPDRGEAVTPDKVPEGVDSFGDPASPIGPGKDIEIDSFGSVISPADTDSLSVPNLDAFGNAVSPINVKPDTKPGMIDGMGNEVSPIDGDLVQSSLSQRASSITTPETVTDVVEVDTDIFGNVVDTEDIRGSQIPFSTVKTPKQFRIGRKSNNNNRRGFIQPRNFA